MRVKCYARHFLLPEPNNQLQITKISKYCLLYARFLLVFLFISDINECEVYPNMQQKCPFGCENTIGSYYCKEGLDSEVEIITSNAGETYTTEMSAPVKTCGNGMMLDGANNCVDIDECAQGNTGCEFCQNTVGSFECTCPDGFELAADQKSCRYVFPNISWKM